MPQSVPNATPPDRGRRQLRRLLTIDVVLPWITVIVLERLFAMPAIYAFGLAALFPVGSMLATWAKFRNVEWIGAGVLLSLAAGIALALLTDQIGFAVLKAAPAFGIFGLASLISTLRERPLMFFVARSFEAGGDPEKLAGWNERMREPRFRAAMQRLSLVWGATCLAEAGLGIAAAFLLPPHVALVAEPLLALVTVASLLAWTYSWRRRAAARSNPTIAAE